MRPGPSATLQTTLTPSVGKAAGWFWATSECASDCNPVIVGADLALAYGFRLGQRQQAISLGVGSSGLFPFFEGYLQVTDGPRPFGIGGRIATPGLSWNQHQIYLRHDRPRGASDRMLFNTGLFIHDGRAPNGSNPGRFVALVQAVGWHHRGERRSWTSALAIGAGRTNRENAIDGEVIQGTVFGSVSLGVHFERRAATPP